MTTNLRGYVRCCFVAALASVSSFASATTLPTSAVHVARATSTSGPTRDIGFTALDVTVGMAAVAPPGGGALSDGGVALAPYIRINGVRDEWGLGIEGMSYSTTTPMDAPLPNAPATHQYLAIDVTPNLHPDINPFSFLSLSLGASFVRARVEAGAHRARVGGGAVVGVQARWSLARHPSLDAVALFRQSFVNIGLDSDEASPAGPSVFVVGISYSPDLPDVSRW